jgi:hypothetical protein
MSAPKKERRLCGTTLRNAEQLAGYVTSSVLQACRSMNRQFVACGANHVDQAAVSLPLVAKISRAEPASKPRKENYQ